MTGGFLGTSGFALERAELQEAERVVGTLVAVDLRAQVYGRLEEFLGVVVAVGLFELRGRGFEKFGLAGCLSGLNGGIGAGVLGAGVGGRQKGHEGGQNLTEASHNRRVEAF